MSPPAPVPASIAVVLVAAGRGTRMGGAVPKQYLDLGGQAVIRRSAEACLATPGVTALLPVIHRDDRALCEAALAGLDDARLLPPVPGAGTRAGSVRAGLEALAPGAPDLVLIHDAARPFLPPEVAARVTGALGSSDGAFAALPVVDALWRVSGRQAGAPVARDGLWRAQTPQGFRFDAILAAHRAHDGQGADDVEVARAAGLSVAVVEGDEANFKITTAADLDRARAMIGGSGRL